MTLNHVPLYACITGMTHDVDWVLIVEKDTVWSAIAQSGFPQLHRCLLVTVCA
jgi:DNA topoisomerase VI subunit A